MRLLSVFVLLVVSPILYADYMVYVTNPFGGDVTQIPIDPNTGAPTLGVTSPDEGHIPNQVAISPNGKYIYVTTGSGLEQFAINPFTGVAEFITHLPTPGALLEIAISPDGKYAYLVIPASGIQQVILDPVTGAPSLGTLLGLSVPLSIVMAPDGSNAYVGDAGGTLSQIILNPITGVPSLGGQATIAGMDVQIPSVTISPDGSNVYGVVVIITGMGSVHQITQFSIDMSGAPSEGSSVAIDPGVSDIAMAPNGENAYFTNSVANTVTQVVVDSMTGAPSIGSSTGSGGTSAVSIVIAPDGANAYVVNENDSHISQIALDPMTGAPTFITFVQNNLDPFDIAITDFSPASSVSLEGKQKRNRFLTQTDIVNVLTWQAFAPALSYNVYRDAAFTNLVGTVPAASPKVEFEDHNRKKGKTYTYYVVANTGSGAVLVGSITVPPNK